MRIHNSSGSEESSPFEGTLPHTMDSAQRPPGRQSFGADPSNVAHSMLDGLRTLQADAVGGTKDNPRFRTRTATAIVNNGEDPGIVLVASSAKHNNKLVFPGGKLALKDIEANPAEPFRVCLQHELKEEVGIEADELLGNMVKIGEATDPSRDVRETSIGDFATKGDNLIPSGDVTSEQLEQIGYDNPASATKVYVSFGNEDSIAIVSTSKREFHSTEELTNPGFVNIREFSRDDFGQFGDGHKTVAAAYAHMLSVIDDAFASIRTGEEAGVKLSLTTLLDEYLRDFNATNRALGL